MRILYERGAKPLKGNTKVGEMVYNDRDGITYTKNKYGDIIIVMQPQDKLFTRSDGMSWTVSVTGVVEFWVNSVLHASTGHTHALHTDLLPLPTKPKGSVTITATYGFLPDATLRGIGDITVYTNSDAFNVNVSTGSTSNDITSAVGKPMMIRGIYAT